jgi:putative membrane protein
MTRLHIALLSVGLCLATQSAFAQAPTKPTDPQIAHIAYTAGQIDIQAAEMALKNSKNKDVRAFANDMIRDHKAVNEKALALVKKLNVKPEDNDTSRSLLQQAQAKQKELRALKGAAFDKAYAQNEVVYHQQVNSALQSTLIPSATNSDLKDLLSTGLKIFQGHQQHAEHLVTQLPSSSSSLR